MGQHDRARPRDEERSDAARKARVPSHLIRERHPHDSPAARTISLFTRRIAARVLLGPRASIPAVRSPFSLDQNATKPRGIPLAYTRRRPARRMSREDKLQLTIRRAGLTSVRARVHGGAKGADDDVVKKAGALSCCFAWGSCGFLSRPYTHLRCFSFSLPGAARGCFSFPLWSSLHAHRPEPDRTTYVRTSIPHTFLQVDR